VCVIITRTAFLSACMPHCHLVGAVREDKGRAIGNGRGSDNGGEIDDDDDDDDPTAPVENFMGDKDNPWSESVAGDGGSISEGPSRSRHCLKSKSLRPRAACDDGNEKRDEDGPPNMMFRDLVGEACIVG
jgi:hypothetical protein